MKIDLGLDKNPLDIQEGKITMGNGEYLVFHTKHNNPPSPKTFERVYQIFNNYAPKNLVHSGSKQANEFCSRRYKLISRDIKKIDPNLEAVFIPSTLYQLMYIRQCIEEGLEREEICPTLQLIRDYPPFKQDHCSTHYKEHRKQMDRIIQEGKCWHLYYYETEGDNQNNGVKEIAYRLNKVMLKAFKPPAEGFTYKEIAKLTEEQINFFKKYNKSSEQLKDIESDLVGPFVNFTYKDRLGIDDDSNAQIIRTAIALDCSKIARESLFLYRGSNLEKDSVLRDGSIHSLSFGTGLFSGCIFDIGATPFWYMKPQRYSKEKNNAYVIPVLFKELKDSPFDIPQTNIIVQMCGCGDMFHARTKNIPEKIKRFSEKIKRFLEGWWDSNDIRQYIKSNFTKDESEVIKRFFRECMG